MRKTIGLIWPGVAVFILAILLGYVVIVGLDLYEEPPGLYQAQCGSYDFTFEKTTAWVYSDPETGNRIYLSPVCSYQYLGDQNGR